MPIARHHIHAGLLPVSRCVTDIDSQRKLVIAHEVNTIDVPITLLKLIQRGSV
jgi:hypothetical protein